MYFCVLISGCNYQYHIGIAYGRGWDVSVVTIDMALSAISGIENREITTT